MGDESGKVQGKAVVDCAGRKIRKHRVTIRRSRRSIKQRYGFCKRTVGQCPRFQILPTTAANVGTQIPQSRNHSVQRNGGRVDIPLQTNAVNGIPNGDFLIKILIIALAVQTATGLNEVYSPLKL